VVARRAGSLDRGDSEVLEGGCKATDGVNAGRETNRTADRRKTPGATPQGARSKVEPGSQTNGYDGPTDVEGQHNTGGPDGEGTARKGTVLRCRNRPRRDRTASATAARYSERENGTHEKSAVASGGTIEEKKPKKPKKVK
jgi:hypothetical protein